MKRILTAALATLALLVAAVPATAATTPTFNGTVGPGFTISMAKKPTKAGKIKLTVADRSAIHNFRLTGAGVSVKTSVAAVGTKSFTVTLQKGKTYRFVCDPHASSMRGSFKVS